MKILALDWGERRLGFAVSDESESIAVPAGVAVCGGEKERRRAVAEKIEETGAGLLVVGLPLTMAGEEGESAGRVREFVERRGAGLGVPVVFWDERGTTDLAERFSREPDSGRRRGGGRAAKKPLDDVAACLLLQSYLDRRGYERRRAQEDDPHENGGER